MLLFFNAFLGCAYISECASDRDFGFIEAIVVFYFINIGKKTLIFVFDERCHDSDLTGDLSL